MKTMKTIHKPSSIRDRRAFAAPVLALLSLCSGMAFAEPMVKTGDRVVFLGDSITAQGTSPHGYITLVEKGLKHLGISIVPLPSGVIFQKSNDLRARLERDVISKRVQFMTFSCGVNDVLQGKKGIPLPDYKVNVTNILSRCAEAGVKVIVLTTTIVNEDPDSETNRKLGEYNAFLRDEAKARNLPLADVFSAMAEQLKTYPADVKGWKMTVDGVHMAPDGNRVMARCVLLAMGVPQEKIAEIEEAWRR